MSDTQSGYQICGCGIPNRANWYIQVIFEKPEISETTYTDIYVCDEHMPANIAFPRDGDGDDGYNIPLFVRQEVRSLLRWEGHESWAILSVSISVLR